MSGATITELALAKLDGGAARYLRKAVAPPIEGPQPLPTELLPVEAFPIKALPEALRPRVEDVAERMNCPPEFVALPLLVSAAMLTARKVSLKPQGLTDWRVTPNLWGAMVGRPGTMKSPALREALLPLHRMDAQEAEANAAAQTAFKVELQAHALKAGAGERAAKKALEKDALADVQSHLIGDEPATPVWRRYVVNNLTYEKLGMILADNPDGVLMERDELRALLVSLGSEDNAEARGMYLQAWGGGRYVFDRVIRGTTIIPDARLSIIGCIQPGPLSELVRLGRRAGSDDGMIERFLIAWPDTAGEYREVDREPNDDARRRAWFAFDYLDKLDAGSIGAACDTAPDGSPDGAPYLRFADDALECFQAWRKEWEGKIKAADSDGLNGALAKFRSHVAALALVCHAIDRGTGAVTLKATARALTLAEYFESHARRLYGSARSRTVQAAKRLLQRVLRPDNKPLPQPFTARDVQRRDWAGLIERDEVGEALEMLVAYSWLREVRVNDGSATGGRPTVAYLLSEGASHG